MCIKRKLPPGQHLRVVYFHLAGESVRRRSVLATCQRFSVATKTDRLLAHSGSLLGLFLACGFGVESAGKFNRKQPPHLPRKLTRSYNCMWQPGRQQLWPRVSKVIWQRLSKWVYYRFLHSNFNDEIEVTMRYRSGIQNWIPDKYCLLTEMGCGN